MTSMALKRFITGYCLLHLSNVPVLGWRHHGDNAESEPSAILSSLLDCPNAAPLPDPTDAIIPTPTALAYVDVDNLEPSPAPSPAMACNDVMSNARGHYSTTRVPCSFRFHSAFAKQKEIDWVDYHTSDLCVAENSIGADLVYKEYVRQWPDECVGDFPRCYSLIHHVHVVASFICAQHWPIPPGTTHISVDCTADKSFVMESMMKERQVKAMKDDEQDWKTTRRTQLTNWIMYLVSFSVGIALFSQFVLQPILMHISTRRSEKYQYRDTMPHFSLESDQDSGSYGEDDEVHIEMQALQQQQSQRLHQQYRQYSTTTNGSDDQESNDYSDDDVDETSQFLSLQEGIHEIPEGVTEVEPPEMLPATVHSSSSTLDETPDYQDSPFAATSCYSFNSSSSEHLTLTHHDHNDDDDESETIPMLFGTPLPSNIPEEGDLVVAVVP